MEEKRTLRENNLELLKSLAVIATIFCHPVIRLGIQRAGYEKEFPLKSSGYFLEMSRNLTPIYFIHWCILGFIDSIFCYSLGVVFPWAVIYLIGAVLLVGSGRIAKWWKNREQAAEAAA